MPDTGHADATPRNAYEREFVAMMDDVDGLIESTENPKHRKSESSPSSPTYAILLAASTFRHPWLLS